LIHFYKRILIYKARFAKSDTKFKRISQAG